jgi:hypothetical protein
MNDLNYSLRNGNVSRAELNTDGITGYVMNGGAAAPAGLAFGAITVVYTIKDVEALGINAAYDTANTVLVYHHLKAHFLRNPRVETYLMLVAQSVTLTQMADIANNYAAKMLREQNGKIKILGIMRNPAAGYTATILNGMDTDSYAAIAKLQQLWDTEFAAKRLLHCAFVEIRSLSTTAGSVYDMRTLNARNVTPVILQDPAIAAGNALFNKYAAVGDVVGLASLAAVSQNIGERTENFQLKIEAENKFMTCAISSGQLLPDADLTTLHNKGYCFGQSIADFDGFYLNDFPVAIPLTDDYAYGYINRVALKTLQVVRKKLLPLVSNNKLQTDSVGLLTAPFRKYLEGVAKKEMKDKLENVGDITLDSSVAYIDPATNVRTSNGAFEIQLSFTDVTLGKNITVSVGLNPNN